MEQLESRYSHGEREQALYDEWERKGYFSVSAGEDGTPYTIVIPPPNVTGFLHMGHALNNTLQDIVIRWKRMQGCGALWVPGTDHAGIATQNVVEKELQRRNLTRQDLGRDRFLEEVWAWKEQYGSRIIFQLKKLGASCDWSRTRFTMDPMLSRAVLTAFVRLYRKGLIYKGKRIIHWCPRCTTALSDEEVEYRDEESSLYYLKYPLVGGGSVEVATTRPETMLGDTAVAVHPADERYRAVSDRRVLLPFVHREIPVIADASVDAGFGTGAVKITPAHDPNDFVLGQRHGLESVVVMTTEGRMNENAGPFQGQERFECRANILEALKSAGLLAGVRPHPNRVGHCYRCETIVEPYLSDQWFVRMEPLAGPAIRAAEEGRLKFYPERWKKVYLQWLYGIRDWCISRQIWWGHRIPVWYCETDGCPPIVDVSAPGACPRCKATKLRQDPDVLDTWFSSWLWPFSVFGWPDRTPDMAAFYPTKTLVTAQEIIFFWVARMVMAGMEFVGEIPFENIYIHGTVRDDTGRKMSKSLGNAIDPVEIIENHGADALRFGIISITASGQDVFLSPSFHVKGRNFVNKVWNAARFILKTAESHGVSRLEEELPERGQMTSADLWILALLDETISGVNASLEQFHFNDAANRIYEFFWHRFCDWYLEIAKLRAARDAGVFQTVQIPILLSVLRDSLKLLHPFVPFVTDDIWSRLRSWFPEETESLMVSRWPVSGGRHELAVVERMERMIEMITAVRDIKTTFRTPLKTRLVCHFDGTVPEDLKEILMHLAGLECVLPLSEEVLGRKGIIVRNVRMGRLAVSLDGVVDPRQEIAKIEKEQARLAGYLEQTIRKLGSASFLEKAPAAVVEKERQRRSGLEEQIRKLKEDIEILKTRT